MTAYESTQVEPKWYLFWQEQGFFKPRDTGRPFSIVMPPPNVTGVLHMGHALVNTLQDVVVRWRRMCGDAVAWVPGTDHAGIATQTVVERHLMATEGKRRVDMDREEFVGRVWEWKRQSEGTIVGQLRRLGCSCDWSRYRFTMDPGPAQAVRSFFHKLYSEGHIYRGFRLVNWDPLTQTALADDEVEYEERQGTIYVIRYAGVDSEGLCVATTRPETLFGDVAVAVGGDDSRYRALVGTQLKLPLTDRTIPVIVDSRVDSSFGTGAVKITPAHDFTDAEIGADHKLPAVNVLTPDGKLNELCGPYAGMSVEEGRAAVLKALQQAGLLVRSEPHRQRVGRSYRSKAVIEPYLSKQWFVRMAPFAQQMRDAVASGAVQLQPANWQATYFHWIDNLRDWCISRQLWWGHRIPVWYNRQDPEQMICWEGEGVPPQVAAKPEAWEQDPDSLDTWFSAALWPVSTLGWPEETADLRRFYPTSLLITGHDILFFWVARMILAGTIVAKQVPFHRAWISGLIFAKAYWRVRPDGSVHFVSPAERRSYDLGGPVPADVHSRWEKMSKSSGNVMDPLELMDEYGTDAVRMALCASATSSAQIDIDLRRFEEYKNFANKIWNGARFVLMALEKGCNLSAGLPIDQLQLEDRWILGRLGQVIGQCHEWLDGFQIDKAAQGAYDFFWNDFCSHYLECAKPAIHGKVGSDQLALKQQVLAIVLCASLRLLHPMAPFITEELFQQLKVRFEGMRAKAECDPLTQSTLEALAAPACMVAAYPTAGGWLSQFTTGPHMEQFDWLQKLIHAVRQIRGEMNLPPKTKSELIVVGALDAGQQAILSALLPLSRIQCLPEIPATIGFYGTAAVHPVTLVVPLPAEMQEREKQRLQKELERLQAQRERVERQLANSDFVSKAPAHLIEQQKSTLKQIESDLKTIAERI